MSRAAGMPSTRRRPIPGMTPNAADVQPPVAEPLSASAPAHRLDPDSAAEPTAARAPVASPTPGLVSEAHAERHQVEDYGTTRLVNFRLPVELHDRYKRLVRDVEEQCPKLRHPSLTEVVIALLSEGPSMPEDVAELIRRKRAAEHGADR